MKKKMKPPALKDFQPGTVFIIKEFDVPLTHSPTPDGGWLWLNWFGGTPSPYDERKFLKQGNHWPAASFEEWLALVQDSL
ncbi:hypothetical protein [Herbaspirillum sp. YR522]|uniref:hypothetical protein n=1 Tax=Herbaspirillum sp. YR522 TaxID=1144342 RepID=UPI00026FA2E7|nr:hypothetical protein [Herbaspirillum sp. YR522]EJN00469.1 hypothetical protein PMI40_03538 [Herbaspirillum sp. YR522]